MNDLHIPDSAYHGVVWPAMPPTRYAPMFALLQQFEHSQWWPAEILERYQLRQLESLAGHAARTVRFYGERLKCIAGVEAGGLTMEMWREVPAMQRTDIQDSGKDLLSRALPKDHKTVGLKLRTRQVLGNVNR